MAIYELSVPPSANRLFAVVKAAPRGRVKASKYRAWINGELKALTAQRARPVGSRASITITLPNGTRGDCDNRIKPVLDLLVRAEVLADDGPKYVGGVSINFGNVKMMRVEVLPAEAVPA